MNYFIILISLVKKLEFDLKINKFFTKIIKKQKKTKNWEKNEGSGRERGHNDIFIGDNG